MRSFILSLVLLAATFAPGSAQEAAPIDLETNSFATAFLLDQEGLQAIEPHGRFASTPLDTRGRRVWIHVRVVSPWFVRSKVLLSREGDEPRVFESREVDDVFQKFSVVEFDEHLEPGLWQLSFGAPTTDVGQPEERLLQVQVVLATEDALALPEQPDLCLAMGYVLAHASTEWVLCRGEATGDGVLSQSTVAGRIPFPDATACRVRTGSLSGRPSLCYEVEYERSSDLARLDARHATLLEGLDACGLDWPMERADLVTDGWNIERRLWTRDDGVRVELQVGRPKPEFAGGEGQVELTVYAPERE